jgi:hypothetical protein
MLAQSWGNSAAWDLKRKALRFLRRKVHLMKNPELRKTTFNPNEIKTTTHFDPLSVVIAGAG